MLTGDAAYEVQQCMDQCCSCLAYDSLCAGWCGDHCGRAGLAWRLLLACLAGRIDLSCGKSGATAMDLPDQSCPNCAAQEHTGGSGKEQDNT
jgi:hypothetical protein